MDMKYAVLLMTDIETFQKRFELAFHSHGVNYHRAVVETENYIQDELNTIKSRFVDGASINNLPITLHRVPFAHGCHDVSFFIAHDPYGQVVALYKIEKHLYGPHETKTAITAITASDHMRTVTDLLKPGQHDYRLE